MWSRHLAAGLVLGLAVIFGSASSASAETRTLKIYFLHTKERAEITYKKNGRYIKSGLQQVNHMLRDWRRNEPTNMDPRLIDLLWEVYRASGSRDYIHVVSGYRAPATNNMLRSRSSGVAKNSQHTLGKAVDFYLPDVKLSTLRNLGLKMHVGGVGYYPKSGSPFVHLDVGSVRHWPRLSRRELASVFPDGKTIHVPSDGKPMPGYQQALAMVKQRQSGGSIQIADDTRQRRGGGLLARIFGGGADEEEDNAESVQVARAPAAQRPAAQQARQQIQPPAPETPGTVLASLPLSALPIPQAAPRSVEEVPPVPVAAAVAEAAVPSDAPDEVAAVLTAANIPLPTRRPDYAPPAAADTQVAMVASESDIELPTVAYVTPSSRPETPKSVDVIGNLLAKQPVEETPPVEVAAVAATPLEVAAAPAAPVKIEEPEAIKEVALAYAADAASAQPSAPVPSPVSASKELALMEVSSNVRPVSRTPKVAPKDARPSAQDLPKPAKPNVQPLSAKVPATLMESVSVAHTSKAIEQVEYSARLAEVPSAVYTTGFTQASVGDPQRFSGKAVQFMSIAKFQ
jgi:uncharacterized protein YcbK (DUF882 family)